MKKKQLLLSLLITIGVSSFAQQTISANQVPANVQNSFNAAYPNAPNVTWEQQQGYFTPIFTVNNTVTKLLIDLKGTLIQTSSHIAVSALPATTASYISANYPGQTVTDAEKLTMFNHATRYEAVVGGHDLIFDATGKYIKAVSGPLKQ